MSSKQKKMLWPVLLLVLMCAGALAVAGGRARVMSDGKPNIPSTTIAPVAKSPIFLPDQSGEQDTQGLVIAIRPDGFVPSNIELTKGRYIFIVQNHSGIRDLTFRLDRDTGERIHELRSQKPKWKNAFDLQPGGYVLSVVDHSKWLCTIRVKSH
jgi:hypothetical protein